MQRPDAGWSLRYVAGNSDRPIEDLIEDLASRDAAAALVFAGLIVPLLQQHGADVRLPFVRIDSRENLPRVSWLGDQGRRFELIVRERERVLLLHELKTPIVAEEDVR